MSRRDQMLQLRATGPHILPSLLLCDFGNLEREVARLTDAGVRALHLDVMDGHFVPNLTYGLPIVEALRRLTDMPLDVHLMIDEPGRYVRQFVEAGADGITVHVEAARDPAGVLAEIRESAVVAGLALNPDTPLSAVEPYWDGCDLVLVMSVPAGFGGQGFDARALDKLRALRREGPSGLLLEVDGGVNRATIADCAAAGAQLMVVGSAIFRSDDYAAAVDELAGRARGR